jgi:hypothetical protein
MRITVNQLKKIISEEMSRVIRDVPHVPSRSVPIDVAPGSVMLGQIDVELDASGDGDCGCEDEYDDSYEDYPLGGASYYDADHNMSSAWKPAQKPTALGADKKPSLKSLFLQADKNNF